MSLVKQQSSLFGRGRSLSLGELDLGHEEWIPDEQSHISALGVPALISIDDPLVVTKGSTLAGPQGNNLGINQALKASTLTSTTAPRTPQQEVDNLSLTNTLKEEGFHEQNPSPKNNQDQNSEGSVKTEIKEIDPTIQSHNLFRRSSSRPRSRSDSEYLHVDEFPLEHKMMSVRLSSMSSSSVDRESARLWWKTAKESVAGATGTSSSSGLSASPSFHATPSWTSQGSVDSSSQSFHAVDARILFAGPSKIQLQNASTVDDLLQTCASALPTDPKRYYVQPFQSTSSSSSNNSEVAMTVDVAPPADLSYFEEPLKLESYDSMQLDTSDLEVTAIPDPAPASPQQIQRMNAKSTTTTFLAFSDMNVSTNSIGFSAINPLLVAEDNDHQSLKRSGISFKGNPEITVTSAATSNIEALQPNKRQTLPQQPTISVTPLEQYCGYARSPSSAETDVVSSPHTGIVSRSDSAPNDLLLANKLHVLRQPRDIQTFPNASNTSRVTLSDGSTSENENFTSGESSDLGQMPDDQLRLPMYFLL